MENLPNLEELKGKLKEAMGIKDDGTLLKLAMWYGLFSLDESPPERLTKEYVDRLRQEAEAKGENVESLTIKGLIGLAEYYKII